MRIAMRSLAIFLVVPVLGSCGDGSDQPPGPTGPTDAVVSSVAVTPDSTYLGALGELAELTAVARDAAGNAISGKTFTWGTSSAQVATVTSTSVSTCEVTAMGPGTATITASTGGVQGTSAAVVRRWIASVELTPERATLPGLGDTVRFTAVATDYRDNSFAGLTFAWSSSDNDVATVAADGLATAVSDGSALITATTYDSVIGDSTSGSGWLFVGPAFWEQTGLTNQTVWSLAIDSLSGHIFAGTDDHGVFRSVNDGDDWSAINSGLTATDVWSLVIDPEGDIFAGTYDGVFRSTNSGVTWTYSGLDENSIRQLTVDAAGNVLVGTSEGLFRSTDKGDNWIVTGFTNDVDRVAVNDSGHIFVGTELNGLFRSTDDGDTWDEINTGFDNSREVTIFSIGIDRSTGHIYTCCPGSAIVYRSTNNGDSWTGVPGGFPYLVFSFEFSSTGHVMAATWGGGVYRSTDGGATWAPVNNGLGNLTVFRLAVDSRDRFFAGTENHGVFRTP